MIAVNVVSAVLSAIPIALIPVILLLFYLDGMVIGKFTPPGALFVAYVAVVTPPEPTLLAVAALGAIASTLGQWTLYRGFNEDRPELIGIRRRIPYLRRLPVVVRRRVGERRMRFVTRTFNRYGGIGLCLTNAIPGVRCLMSIPAGLSRYPIGRFLLFSTVGNALYMVLLIGVARGLLGTVRFLPSP